MNTLKTRAVLMRLTMGLPGESRQDENLTAEVKSEHSLGENAGKWMKALFPPDALKTVKEVQVQARKYHDSVTLPFDKGIGILPAALIKEYGDKMRDFKDRRDAVIARDFVPNYDSFIEWARSEQNGTFDPDLYPPIDQMLKKFFFRTNPLPVPDSAHFENNVASLLGVDTQSVDDRVADAAKDAQKELMRRIIEPVQYMAKTLSKEKPKIFETLITNLEDIIRVAPALNLSGDPQIDAFVKEMEQLTQFGTDQIRKKENIRATLAAQSQALMEKLSGYAL